MKKILLFFLVCLLISCVSRQVENTKKQEEVKSESTINSEEKNNVTLKKSEETNVKIESVTKIDNKDETVVKETSYEPQDKSKPGVITDEKGQKIILDNIKKVTKETIQKNNKKTENVKKDNSTTNIITDLNKSDSSKVAIKEKVDNKSNSSVKNSNKKPFNMFSLLCLLIPIILILLLIYVWKKYRSFIPGFS